VRKAPSSLYGIQSWLAQPLAAENGDPAFSHTGKAELPSFDEKGIRGRVIIGSFQGIASPVPTQWETQYVDVSLDEGASLEVPKATEERALYVLDGTIGIAGASYEPQQMLVLSPGDDVTVRALTPVRMMLLGGAAMDGPRYIFWNFVASSKERLEQAKQDWREGRFPKVPGDAVEFIPLPE
jgi:redox-sensitive bicupin YhaK (pirin superfamily)